MLTYMSLRLPGDSHSAKTLNTLVNGSTFCSLAGSNGWETKQLLSGQTNKCLHWSKKLKHDPSE